MLPVISPQPVNFNSPLLSKNSEETRKLWLCVLRGIWTIIERQGGREIKEGKFFREKGEKNIINIKPVFSMVRNLTVKCHRTSADTKVDKCIYLQSGEVAEKTR